MVVDGSERCFTATQTTPAQTGGLVLQAGRRHGIDDIILAENKNQNRYDHHKYRYRGANAGPGDSSAHDLIQGIRKRFQLFFINVAVCADGPQTLYL